MNNVLPISEFKVDKLTVKVYDTRINMGKAAMLETMVELNRLTQLQDTIRMIFAAAPSQNEFLDYLRQQIDFQWNKVEAFHMDEYIELPEGSPQRFGNFLNEKIFRRLPFKKVNFIQPDPKNPDFAISEYIGLLQQKPIDIVALGIGENAHIAFNDPPVADFNDPDLVKIVALDDVCRQQQVNDGNFISIEMVPKNAITLTVPALLSGKKLVCIVPGNRKSQAVYNALTKEITELYPASILRRHNNATLFLDKEAASLL
jgi:glucosamine-6-phosphate deaminase